jgi:hypothetical protein
MDPSEIHRPTLAHFSCDQPDACRTPEGDSGTAPVSRHCRSEQESDTSVLQSHLKVKATEGPRRQVELEAD